MGSTCGTRRVWGEWRALPCVHRTRVLVALREAKRGRGREREGGGKVATVRGVEECDSNILNLIHKSRLFKTPITCVEPFFQSVRSFFVFDTSPSLPEPFI
jgi:hypothetical protein